MTGGFATGPNLYSDNEKHNCTHEEDEGLDSIRAVDRQVRLLRGGCVVAHARGLGGLTFVTRGKYLTIRSWPQPEDRSHLLLSGNLQPTSSLSVQSRSLSEVILGPHTRGQF